MSEKKIIIVDDALYMRAMLRDILTKGGYNIVGEAQSGKEMIEKVSIQDADLITVDLIMPEIDGINGLDAIKEAKKIRPEMKILVVSALADKESYSVEIEKVGVDGFINKPFEKEDILNKLDELLA